MKRIIFFLCLVVFIKYSLADGAFGTHKGMTKEDLKQYGVVFINNGNFTNDAPIKNKNFTLYLYSFDKEGGLCRIKGITNLLKTNESGSEIRYLFSVIKETISIKYGLPFEKDNFSSLDKNYFMENIKKQILSEYYVVWNASNKSIKLTLEAKSSNEGYLTLDYFFKNCLDSALELETDITGF